MTTILNLPAVNEWLGAQIKNSMVEKIFQYSELTLGVVSESAIAIGQAVITPNGTTYPQTHGVITSIIEQRKERGSYTNESKRRNWARVVVR